MANPSADPSKVLSAAAFKKRQTGRPPEVKAVPQEKLIEIASSVFGRKINLARAPTAVFTARHPYDTAGYMNVIEAARWDSQYTLVYMNVLDGPFGEWANTWVEVYFTAPEKGTYFVAATFSGDQITMEMHGPWGKSTAYCATTSDSALVTGLWTGAAGENLSFNLDARGEIMAFLESVQIWFTP